METIQEIIDTIKQWPSTIWWVMGALFIISWFWDTPLRKKRNKDKMTDDKNNDLKSSNMTDKKEFGGNLMKEGIFVWVVFAPDGKAGLYMDGEKHLENGTYAYGNRLSTDVSSFHEICNLDNKPVYLHFPEHGISVRYRIRLRYSGTDDAGIERSEHEPETCLPAWIVRGKTGQTGLYLQKWHEEKCFIPDMSGLPGLPDLQPDGIPVRIEMLIREAYPFFDLVKPASWRSWGISSNPASLKGNFFVNPGEGNLTGEGVVMWTVFTGDGKAALYMDDLWHLENGILAYGERLSHDVPVLHKIFNLEEMLLFRHFPKRGVPQRIRMQLRFPGTGEACKDRPDSNRETYFPAWAVPEESGRISLYLQEQLSGECDIQDISRIPGAPKLQPNGVPVRVEILLQQEGLIFDTVRFLKEFDQIKNLKTM